MVLKFRCILFQPGFSSSFELRESVVRIMWIITFCEESNFVIVVIGNKKKNQNEIYFAPYNALKMLPYLNTEYQGVISLSSRSGYSSLGYTWQGCCHVLYMIWVLLQCGPTHILIVFCYFLQLKDQIKLE